MYMGDTRAKNPVADQNRTVQPPQRQPLHPTYNNGISYNGVDQDTTGTTTPQQNTTGVPYQNLNSSYTMNYGRGGGQLVYNPPVTTQPVPTPTPTPLPATQMPAPALPWYAVPNGRPQNAGLTKYTDPNGVNHWGAGTGGGSFDFQNGVAYHPAQSPFGGQFPGYGFQNIWGQAHDRRF